MSLAQKTETLPTTTREGVPPTTGATPFRLNQPIDFRQLARRPIGAPALATVKGAEGAGAAPASRKAAPVLTMAAVGSAASHPAVAAEVPLEATPAPVEAMNLLSEVSAALSTLMDRCQSLESTLEVTRNEARADLEAADEAKLHLEKRVEALTGDVGQLERSVADLRERLAAAEESAAAMRGLAEKTQHAAAQAECLSALFQQKVMTTFGVGSAGHSILESVRSRTQAMLTA